jgi:hypothetical protein
MGSHQGYVIKGHGFFLGSAKNCSYFAKKIGGFSFGEM